MTIALIGGTGPLGRGLGYRFALAGHKEVLGSRAAERAAASAGKLAARLPAGASLRGAGNVEAAAGAGLVVLAVPCQGHRDLVSALRPHLAGKVVVSCANPLGFDRAGPYGLAVPEGSVAEQAAVL